MTYPHPNATSDPLPLPIHLPTLLTDLQEYTHAPLGQLLNHLPTLHYLLKQVFTDTYIQTHKTNRNVCTQNKFMHARVDTSTSTEISPREEPLAGIV